MESEAGFQFFAAAIIGLILCFIAHALITGRIIGGWRPILRDEDPSLFYRGVSSMGMSVLFVVGMMLMAGSEGAQTADFKGGFTVFFFALSCIHWIGLSIAVTHGVIANPLTRNLRDVFDRARQPVGFWPTFVLFTVSALFCTYGTVRAFQEAIQ